MKKDYVLKQRIENAYIFPNVFVIGHVFTDGLKKILDGRTFGETMCIYKDNLMYWYASESKVKSCALELFKQLTHNPHLIKQAIVRFEKKSKFLLGWVKKNSQNDWRKISNDKLSSFWNKYLKLYESAYLDSEPLVICAEEYLSGYLSNYFKKISKAGQNSSTVYNLLVSSREKSFVKREEDDLIALAFKVKKGKIKNVNWAIEKHVKKYQWIPFNYGMYVWDGRYFKKILWGMLKNPELAKKIVASENYFKNISGEQTRLEKELRIDKKHRQYFIAMRQAGYLLDYKKEIFTQIHFYAEKILQETGKRLGIERELVQYYLPKEIERALMENKVLSRDILEARQKHCYVRWFDNDIEVKTDNPDSLIAAYLFKKNLASAKFEGIIAAAGKYVGKVKVLHSANEINKVKSGDILVAAMTSPDYVPAMRRAGAIITDEGGVMCHAAIVSRELGIPCVVGTGNATKLLHDGEIIEVNANHNSVRIIKC